ncbi:MAG: hypothetical protein HY216_12550 [Candidatus Rokubacteria bacterium]|nr:hypothetical protein [Candidatus Rokubacteria bacterium]
MRRKPMFFVWSGLVAGAVALAALTPRATAQGGGTIEAEVKYGGAPVIEKLKVNKDVEQCGQETTVEKIAVGANKGLASAVVSLPGAAGGAAPKKAVLDQKGCKFQPNVVATVAGDVDIANSDGILHNVHTYSSANPSLNKAQPKFKKVMTEKFEKPEYIKIQCDVHSWMLGWIAVMPNAHHGVTDANGVVKLDNVPPGKQTVEIWHPELGKQTKEVEVKAGQVTKISFEMKK